MVLTKKPGYLGFGTKLLPTRAAEREVERMVGMVLVRHAEVQILGHYTGKDGSERAAIPPCHSAHL